MLHSQEPCRSLLQPGGAEEVPEPRGAHVCSQGEDHPGQHGAAALWHHGRAHPRAQLEES